MPGEEVRGMKLRTRRPTGSARRGATPGRQAGRDAGNLVWCASSGSEDAGLWEEMDWVARECGLSPTEKAVLSMARLESYTHAEIAAELGLTPRAVAEVLVDALRKACARFEQAASPRALFWEEIRQKSRCIYQQRRIRWLR
jgi:DNA-directed RNA polymerase specialized sigma24 family protein